MSTLTTVATCSSVIRGFFPPKPLGLFGQEEHRDSRAQPVPDQATVRPDLERTHPGLLFGTLEPLFDVPTGER